jgi:hypothetical protein
VVLVASAVAIAAGLAHPAHGQNRRQGRVVVVSPDSPRDGVRVNPNEKVGAVTVVRLAAGPVAVVRLDPMPQKADFNVITPAGISHPYRNGATGAAGITVTWTYTYIHSPRGDYWRVTGIYTRAGRGRIGKTWKDFPPGSQVVPDPPQPPGTMFFCPDAMPVSPEEEEMILAEAGMPNNPFPEVWAVPSNDFLFVHDAWMEPELVRIGADPTELQAPVAAVEAVGIERARIAPEPARNGDTDEITDESDGDSTDGL